MNNLSSATSGGLARQREIQAKCRHPAGRFIEFKREEIQQSIPARFEEQVLKYPGRVAIASRNQQLTYLELNQAANQVARAILDKCGQGEESVALLFEQSVQAFVAMLGVLKAGKRFVPLDPALPRNRTVHILENSQASLLVTNRQNQDAGKELAQNACQLLDLDQLDTEQSTENLGLPISPDNLAWIVYTSGSTGQPKGVAHTHRNVLHMVMNYTNKFHVCAEDRVVHLFSYSVHAGAYITFATLLNGAGLYPLDIRERGLTALADLFLEQRITVYGAVPTVFRHFAGSLTGKELFPSVRLVFLGGEPVYNKDVELFKKCFSRDCIFVNRLGSTEADAIRMYFMDQETSTTDIKVPCGYPLDDQEVLLLDDNRQPVAFDSVGEIAVKSPFIAQGYWRRPDLTEAAFPMISPPGSPPGSQGKDQRIYLTGDLGCMKPDGCLIHLGRKDFQVKIRGYRIEVAEIEMALLELDNVKEAVVVARANTGGDQRLVAYIVPAQQPPPVASELRTALSGKLPAYMMPSAFVFLDGLPHAPNGKVNRRELPEPDGARPQLGNPYVPPRTAAEEALSAIWAQVLGLNRVGVDDNFLELGGDSLLATQVISRVINACKVNLPLRVLFAAPTVAQMAVVVAQHQANQAKVEDVERLLAELEALSEEQAKQLLAGEVAELHQGRPSPHGRYIGRQQ
ncbi:MAG TPA: non-ribosomal peptide synthetase [Dehalococcoidia bacterium]|nr:non-ribosomal peptide synthetase [Dehalococcoidia bacterium]